MEMDINYFKKKLEEEKERLETSLSKIAQPNPKDPDDWRVKPGSGDMNIMPSDQSEMADTLEELADITAAENELEQRLNEIKTAINRIKENKYGICEAEGCKIEKERLEADPAATTCTKHLTHI